jgi:DNA-binding GntR family transcriptional regulator
MSIASSAARTRRTIRHGSSVETAFELIRELIVHGKLSPGTRIVETDLTERLGMSRTPVRGALQWLQREGYVLEQKGKSKSRMLVAPLTKEDARELYAVVAHVEGLAGRQTASLPRERRNELIPPLRKINEQLDDIARTGALQGRSIFDLDLQFHRIIVEAGAGRRLLQLYNAIKPQTERYWRLYASNILDQLYKGVAEHNTIISSIKKGDPDATEAALVANWVNGSNRLAEVISFQGERGTW